MWLWILEAVLAPYVKRPASEESMLSAWTLAVPTLEIQVTRRCLHRMIIYVLVLQALASSIFCYSFPGLVAAYREIQSEGFGQFSQLYSLILAFIAIGGLGYGCKLPERWAPGYFDFVGRSLPDHLSSMFKLSSWSKWSAVVMFPWHQVFVTGLSTKSWFQNASYSTSSCLNIAFSCTSLCYLSFCKQCWSFHCCSLLKETLSTCSNVLHFSLSYSFSYL